MSGSKKSRSGQKSPRPKKSAPALQSPPYVVVDMSEHLYPGSDFPFWVMEPAARACCMEAIDVAVKKGQVVGGFKSAEIAELCLMVVLDPPLGENPTFKERSVTDSTYLHPQGIAFELFNDGIREDGSCGHTLFLQGAAVGRFYEDLDDEDLSIARWVFARLRQKHAGAIDAAFEADEAEHQKRCILEMFAKDAYTQQIFEGICEAAGRARREGLDIEDLVDHNEFCIDSALHAAKWLVEQSAPGTWDDGLGMVDDFLVEAGAPNRHRQDRKRRTA